VQRIAAVGGSEARPAILVGAPVNAVVAMPVTMAGSAWRLFGSVVVDGGMAMRAKAVILVVDIDVPMSAGIGGIAHVGMRVVMACTVAETHRVRMGVGAVPVHVAMLNQA
jgi:hypothetical protein